jgi:hypothetical protein
MLVVLGCVAGVQCGFDFTCWVVRVVILVLVDHCDWNIGLNFGSLHHVLESVMFRLVILLNFSMINYNRLSTGLVA